ncbi:hypothetical protein [Diaphorobacter ruginosibacter]|uniref:hypothetical protein n=1 Tax=Diaphorobacter ruginosibacter TaxID=1715720 RepID=UPI00334116CD
MPSNKYIITTRTGDGPVMAVDLRTLPQEVTLSIVNAAVGVSTLFQGGGMGSLPDDGPAEEVLVDLMVAAEAIEPFMTPTTPGIRAIRSNELLHSYSVIRHGAEVIVPVLEMTELEIEATILRIHSEELAAKDRIEALKSILASGKSAADKVTA